MRSEFDARRLEKKLTRWFVIALVVGAFLGAMHYDHQLLEAGLIN